MGFSLDARPRPKTRRRDEWLDSARTYTQDALMTSAPPWWRAEIHADRRPLLIQRNTLTRAVRAWFETRDFIEVEAASLQTSPGNEAHLHAFSTDLCSPRGAHERLYLHTSPEFACKKLLAAGERRIFDFARVWRNRERGPLHHPEFTLLEWYRTHEPYEALMDDCAALLCLAAETTGRRRFAFRGKEIDPFSDPERLSVAEAFDRFAGIDLLATVALDEPTAGPALAEAARAKGVRVADDDAWPDVFSRVMVEKIEPNLGIGRATILYEYPSSQAALARLSPNDPRVAERFELYACGVELANAFSELTDADEQRRRFELEMHEKARVYGELYPLDEDFLTALASMPPASGAALGFDRLAMLATGATRIEQVLWTPVVDPFQP